MDIGKDKPVWQFRRYILVIYAILVVVALPVVILVFFSNIFRTSEAGSIPELVWLMAAGVLLFMVILMLSRLSKIFEVIEENNAKLEKIAEAMERNHAALSQIAQSVRLSETAKVIAFRDADRQSLREAVFDKLQQQDFKTASEMIDEIANRAGYEELAEQLRAQTNKYRDATDQERTKQVIAHIEKLFESYQWAEASTKIERLIETHPKSDEAKALRQKLLDKKEERKKILFTAWDDAVQRGATDRSLEILRDLDQYLTPNEGLALQEAAKDIFKTKLHNLGVQFSLAVSGEKWTKALEVGRQITRDFPNSKMAEEIREKLDVLKQKVGQEAG